MLILTALFLRIFSRALGALWFAPCFGAVEVPKLFRVATAFALSALIFPVVFSNAHFEGESLDLARLAGSVSLEFFFGAILGLSLTVFFNAARLFGEVVAHVGGISVAGFFDPSSGEESSAPTRLFFWIAIAVFVLCGGIESFVDGTLDYYSVPTPELGDGVRRFAELIGTALSSSFLLGFKLCAPFIAATGVAYLALGFASRASSSQNLSAAAFNLASLLTLIVLPVALGVFCRVFKVGFVDFLRVVRTFF